jgi:membrane-associated phospholipid phosphatase
MESNRTNADSGDDGIPVRVRQQVWNRDGVRELVREFSIVGLGMLIYFGVRGVTQGSKEQAFANARMVHDAERVIGLDWEQASQLAVIQYDSVATLANWIYIYGHWPVILTTMIVLQRRKREYFTLLRTSMFISGLIGFAFFYFMPMAPPRFVDPSIVDTVTQRSEGYRVLQPPQIANLYASMPSLHAGWNVLVGIVVFRATSNWLLRLWAVIFPVMMAWAVVVTGNHYILDVIVGEAVALIGYFAAILLRRRRAAILLQGERSSTIRDRPPSGQ